MFKENILKMLEQPEVKERINQVLQEELEGPGLKKMIGSLVNSSELSQRVAKLENERPAETHSSEDSKVKELEQQITTLQQQIPQARKQGAQMEKAVRNTVEKVFGDLDAAAEEMGITDTWLKLAEEAKIFKERRAERDGGDGILTVGWD